MIRTITLILFAFFVFAQSFAQDKLNLDPTNYFPIYGDR